MATKQQSTVYRVIQGVRYENYCELCFDDSTNLRREQEARKRYNNVRKIKNTASGFYQLFVAFPKIVGCYNRSQTLKIVYKIITDTVENDIDTLSQTPRQIVSTLKSRLNQFFPK